MKNTTSLGPLALALLAVACSDSSLGGRDDDAGRDPNTGVVGAMGDPGLGGAETRVVRLSHDQYASTLRDLLGIEETPQGLFAPDALNGFAFDTTTDFRVDSRLGPQYRAAAEELSALVLSDGAVFNRLVPCDAGDAGCSTEFIASFGERAFRRPLTETEATRFAALFTAGATLGDSGDEFRDGVQIVVEAMLQSPQFLYRTETSDGQIVDGRELLSDWEVASRLSYFLYDSMPDDELFERARQGELRNAEQIAAEVSRMLDDDRAVAKFVSFHEQLWQFGRFATISPDSDTYPNAPVDMIDRVRAASSRFVESVIDEGGGLAEFLTAPYAFADSELAPLYGTSAGGGLTRIDFPDEERKGFMMQLGFLASNAYSVKTDPIHRGLFVLRDLLCRDIPDPPPGAQMTPPPEATEPIETTRDEITLLTGQLYCPTCHSQINEPGFAFEGFDAIGQAREQENGVDVDTTGSITLDGVDVEFDGAHELVDALAQSDEARDCYSGRWLEFASGRRLTAEDDVLLDQLAAQPQSVQEIVTTMVTSSHFLSRDVSEVTE